MIVSSDALVALSNNVLSRQNKAAHYAQNEPKLNRVILQGIIGCDGSLL